MIIQFKTKDEYKKLKSKYEKQSNACWKMYMYNFFKGSIWCYYEEEDCFISLYRAEKLGLETVLIESL